MHVPEAWAVHGAHRAAQGSVEDSSGFFQRLHRASGGGGQCNVALGFHLGFAAPSLLAFGLGCAVRKSTRYSLHLHAMKFQCMEGDVGD